MLLGDQTPTHFWVPPHVSSAGAEAADLAASAGLPQDDWQKLFLDAHLAESRPGVWTCFETGLILSRQNGKDAAIEARELAGLFLFHDPLIIHSAHLFTTSREHFFRIISLIDNHDDFRKRVKAAPSGKGDEAIEVFGPPGSRLTQICRLKFMTRKGGAGRGFTGSVVVFNEAMYLDAMAIAAMIPTLATIPNCQIIYMGSAGFKTSTQLAAIRRRGMRGAIDPSEGDPDLAYLGWEADKPVYEGDGDERVLVAGDDPASPRTWAKVNPSFNVVGHGIAESYIRKEMTAMGGPDSPAFYSERLGIGDWPVDDEERWEVFSKEQWEHVRDLGEYDQASDAIRMSQIVGPRSFGMATDAERDTSVIGAVGLSAAGRLQYEVVERRRGTSWLLGRAKELNEEHHPHAFVVRATSATASVIAALQKAKVKVESPTTAQYAQACGAMFEDVTETGVAVHLGQPSLTAAAASARKEDLSEGGWHWTSDTRPEIKAVTLARHDYATAPEPAEPFIFVMGRPSRQGLPPGAHRDVAGELHAQSADRGAAGYAAARRGRGQP